MAARRSLVASASTHLRLRPPTLITPRRCLATGPNSPSPSSSSKPAAASAPASRYEKQRRNEWIVIAVSGAIAATGAYYWSKRKGDGGEAEPLSITSANTASSSSSLASSSSSSSPSLRPNANFSIVVRNPQTGEKMTKALVMLSDADVTARLRQNERVVDVAEQQPTADCLVSRYYVNSVAANAPIEDRSSQFILPASPQGSGPASASAFFAVMDGHAGWDTSELLSHRLIPEVASHVEAAHRLAHERANNPGLAAKIKALITSAAGGAGSVSEEGVHAELVSKAIESAFLKLDKGICGRPVELLRRHERQALDAKASTSTSPHANSVIDPQTAYQTMLPALSGSCALLTYIDTAHSTLYVACTGDSRALAGYHDPSTGQWSVEPLSEDQTGRNAKEQARMRAEHPVEEAEHVVMRGRVLGGLEPTRAFGDARYKWDKETQMRLREAFLPKGANGRGPPQLLRTPPYVTARPVIEVRRLPINGKEGGKQLRFIVMATDGLWDMLSNEEVGSLVAGHLSEVKGKVSKEELEARVFAPQPGAVTATSASSSSDISKTSPSSSSSSSSSHHPLARARGSSIFSFQDSNLATHLVRNALGGSGEQRVNAYLAIPEGDARRYRDDITVNVILFDEERRREKEGKEGQGQGVGEGEGKKYEEEWEKVKAKATSLREAKL